MKQILASAKAAALIPDGAVLFFGGYMGRGSADRVIDALLAKGTKNLTVIANDGGQITGEKYIGVARLIHAGQISHLIATHVGLNAEVGSLVKAGLLRLSLLPQGSLAEMIRAGGAGLGGILTPSGVGTDVENSPFAAGKQIIDEQEYLMMRPLRADFAILSAYEADPFGNLWYKGTSRAFNQVMALAADTVIVQAERLVSAGDILPENVMTPGVFVDYIVKEDCYG